MIRAVVFDFDGTIADTFQAVVDSLNEVRPRYRYDRIEDAEHFRDKNWFHVIFRELKIPVLRLPGFYRRVKRAARSRFLTSELFPDLSDLIIALEKKYTVAILTSNRKNVVRSLLEQNNLHVDSIIASVPLFRKHRALRAFCKQRGFEPREVLYIGDEVRDIIACKKAGVPIAAVSWGFQSDDLLRRASPDYLVGTPPELLQLILGLGASSRRQLRRERTDAGKKR